MRAQERLTINRLANFFRRVSHRYENMTLLEKEREAHLLRNKLQHLRRTKSMGLLIDMLRDLEGRRPITSTKLDRVMINLREISISLSTPKDGGVEHKLFAQPPIASILLLSQCITDKSIFR